MTGDGRRVSDLYFVNRCFSDRSVGIGVPASIPLHDRAKFTSAAHAEGTLRWLSPAGCDAGTLGFGPTWWCSPASSDTS